MDLILGPLALFAFVMGTVWIDDFFIRNWDSIYDPRSKFQIWRDKRHEQ